MAMVVKVNEEQENTDMKVVKFDAMVVDIIQYLEKCPYAISVGCKFKFLEHYTWLSYIPRCIYSEKKFIKVIASNMFGVLPDNVYQYESEITKEKRDINETEIISLYKGNIDKYKYKCHFIIFWMLFTTAIDDEIYNNELSNIIDFAYCLDFNEVMIRDWCRAIEYVLAGNHFSEDCDLVCESEEGKAFFLHK